MARSILGRKLRKKMTKKKRSLKKALKHLGLDNNAVAGTAIILSTIAIGMCLIRPKRN